MKEEFSYKEVESAGLWHLVYGIAYVITDITLVVIMAQIFRKNGFVAGLCTNLFLLFLFTWCLIHTSMIKMYFERTSFKIYYAPLSNATDIDTIKMGYSIHMVDENGIIFTRKEDDGKYSSYCLMNDITIETIKESAIAER